jgi:hypothetical protein
MSLYYHRHYFTAKSLLKHLGSLQTFETPAAEFLLANVFTSSLALLVLTVAVPRIDGIKRAAEATIGNSDLYYERKVAFVDASCHFLLSGKIAHG